MWRPTRWKTRAVALGHLEGGLPGEARHEGDRAEAVEPLGGVRLAAEGSSLLAQVPAPL
ncbi:hypothetical protein ABZ078_25385 [Streptomyces sp. NPDC006385]|uniref:hypothetical protein n=1 Tax=Streptomyces sp. NPDC006385 TaxID=3156761 RepID=UPI0033A849C8